MAENDTYKPAPPQIATPDRPDPALKQKADADRESAQRKAQRAARKQADQAEAAARKSARPKTDPLRPLKLAGAFVGGTVMGTMKGAGSGAHYGFWVGGAAGLLAMTALSIGGGGLIAAVALVSCIVGGMGIGVAGGTLFGGIKGVRDELNIEKKAEMRAKANQPERSKNTSRVTSSDIGDDQRLRGELNFDRSRQQDIENREDQQTYWQDRVGAEAGGWGMGRN